MASVDWWLMAYESLHMSVFDFTISLETLRSSSVFLLSYSFERVIESISSTMREVFSAICFWGSSAEDLLLRSTFGNILGEVSDLFYFICLLASIQFYKIIVSGSQRRILKS
jgi:hypothetical protein